MNRFILLISALSMLYVMGCVQEPENEDPWSASLTDYENNPTAAEADTLFALITPDPWIVSVEVNRAERMNKAYEIAEEQGMKDTARTFLRALILQADTSTQRSVYLDKMTKLYDENDRRNQIGYYINQAKGGSPEELDSSINRLGHDLYDSARQKMDVIKARQFVDACEAYALTHPDDPQSAEYLHSAAETARSLRQFERSLFYYQWIYEEFPDSEKRPLAHFLTGFTYDDNLDQVDSARKYYKAFVENFPDHELADDAQFLIKNLGKSEDEIMQSLEK